MFFEQESISFQILDVLYISQKSFKRFSHKRNFDALSFRFEADTSILCKNKQMHFPDDSIGFFPANVDYGRVSKHDKMIVIHFKAFNYQGDTVEQCIPNEPEKYRKLFEKIHKCWTKKAASYKHEAAALLNLIFAELYKDNKKEKPSSSKISDAVKYIENNCFRHDFSLPLAAEKSYISEPYFRKLFRQEFGISPQQYVIRRRLRHAASLIITGYYSLSEIADLCGYNDYKYFSTEFKRHMGISPSAYKYNFRHK